jgi:cytoskeletal protein CcmA (bactofilin family)
METTMSDHDAQITVIGPDTRIKGEMSFERTARLLGHFEGRVTTPGELQIGASAHCKAALEAGTLIVDGQVEGDVLARERVQLNGTAKVVGDIVAERLIVSEGASFSGHCRIGPEAVAAAKPKPGVAIAQPKPLAPLPEPKAATGPKFDWVGQPVTTDAASKTGWGPVHRQPAEGAA